MTDVLTKKQRSYNMSRIKGKDTKVELELRRRLRMSGIKGYRLHPKSIFGRPDLIFISKRLAVFVDGCEWHKCRIHFVEPKSNSGFWREKIEGNIKRDKIVNKRLKALDWLVIRIWEHDLKKEKINKAISALLGKLKKREISGTHKNS